MRYDYFASKEGKVYEFKNDTTSLMDLIGVEWDKSHRNLHKAVGLSAWDVGAWRKLEFNGYVVERVERG